VSNRNLATPDDSPFDVRRRRSATSSTWLKKVAALYRQQMSEARTEDERWLLGYDASQVVWLALNEIETLSEIIPDDLLDPAHEAAARLANRLRARRLAAQLDGNLTGRTPEEAAAFRAKAEELRRG
jgi:hypothetical protein